MYEAKVMWSRKNLVSKREKERRVTACCNDCCMRICVSAPMRKYIHGIGEQHRRHMINIAKGK